MKKVLKCVFDFFVNLFKTNEMKVEIFSILTMSCDSPELKELRDADLMNKAWELVKQLHVRTDLTAKQKASIFNERLFYWGQKVGKVIGTTALNIVREIAYTTLKIAISKGLVTLLLANGKQVTADTVTCRAKPEQLELDLEPDFELKA